jgi:hypothetical protein
MWEGTIKISLFGLEGQNVSLKKKKDWSDLIELVYCSF